MIPRLHAQSTDSRRHLTWTDTDNEPPLWPFDGQRRLRKLRVLIDADAWPAVASGKFTLNEILAGLLTDPSVEFWRYRDNGPPDELAFTTENADQVPPGWVDVSPHGELSFGDGMLDVRVGSGPGSERLASFDRGLIHMVAGPIASQSSADDSDVRQRLLDGRAATVAVAINADIFITTRDHLLKSDRFVLNCRMTSVAEGIAIVGLYLRAQDRPTIYRHFDFNGQVTSGTHEFYWVGACGCLPWSWRWRSVFRKQSELRGEGGWIYEAESVISRLSQALQARDRVHIALNRSRSNSSNDDVASSFDILALMLLAALDAAAAAISLLYGLPGRDNPSFGNANWIKEAEKVCRPITEIFRKGSDGWRMLCALKVLRNTIHHAALSPLMIQDGERPHDRLAIRLPKSYGRELRHYFEKLGGMKSWGVRHITDEFSFADPGILTDRLLSATIHYLNNVMEVLPIERLEGINVSSDDIAPPKAERNTPFHPWSPAYMNSIRWQLAVDPFIPESLVADGRDQN
ncbi:hypothetical protein AB0J83_28050 [Actinoplanes sp. NPDC049596]|uniref:hypothetical protein n=1 Tax=unclassified Actinoplanes TaxID=2626549 RepID=UPI00343C92A9